MTRTRTIRRISERRPSSEELRQRWIDARVQLAMFRFAGPVALLCTFVMCLATTGWTSALLAALSLAQVPAIAWLDRFNREEVETSRQTWLLCRVGASNDNR